VPTQTGSDKGKLEIRSGNGIKLGDSPAVEEALKKTKPDEDVAKNLHMLLFKQAGTKTKRKANIRQFSGFPDGDAEKNDAVERMNGNNKKYSVAALKDMCHVLGLQASGNREELIQRVADYLVSPTSLAAGTKRKSSSGRRSKGKKGKKAKKRSGGMGPYMIFSNEVRADVRSENPSAGFGDLGRLIGERWRALSDAEKEEYKEKAAQLKAERAAQGGNESEPEEEDEGKEEENGAEDEEEDEEEDEGKDEEEA
jgi:protein DEK